MLIHISQNRFRAIVKQGYGLTGTLPDKFGPKIDIIEGGEYHLLDDEYGVCEVCGQGRDSVPVNTPTDLEVVKTIMKTLEGTGQVLTMDEMKAHIDWNRELK